MPFLIRAYPAHFCGEHRQILRLFEHLLLPQTLLLL